jgi:hypothetical protein
MPCAATVFTNYLQNRRAFVHYNIRVENIQKANLKSVSRTKIKESEK